MDFPTVKDVNKQMFFKYPYESWSDSYNYCCIIYGPINVPYAEPPSCATELVIDRLEPVISDFERSGTRRYRQRKPGIYSSTTIERGQMIIMEKPLYRIERQEGKNGRVLRGQEEVHLAEVITRMNKEKKEAFYSLPDSGYRRTYSGVKQFSKHTAKAIHYKNLLQLGAASTYEEKRYVGVCTRISRINSSKSPNARLRWCEFSKAAVVIALKHLTPGDEVLLSEMSHVLRPTEKHLEPHTLHRITRLKPQSFCLKTPRGALSPLGSGMESPMSYKSSSDSGTSSPPPRMSVFWRKGLSATPKGLSTTPTWQSPPVQSYQLTQSKK